MAKLPDLSALSLDELTQLHHHVSQHLEERKQARIKELQAELTSLGGIDPFGIKKPAGKPRVGNGREAAEGATRAKPEPKYRAPNGATWTGRGGIPRAFQELGVTDKAGMQKYLIKK